jgi:hypothetical protein
MDLKIGLAIACYVAKETIEIWHESSMNQPDALMGGSVTHQKRQPFSQAHTA